MNTTQFKRFFLKILIFAVIVVLVFSPCLLLVDYKRYSPFVFLVWIVSVAYFLWMKRRESFNMMRREIEEKEDGGEGEGENEAKSSNP